MNVDSEHADWADAEYRRLSARAPAFRVSAYIHQYQRLQLDFRELLYVRYPFDAVEFVLDESDPELISDTGDTRMDRMLFVRNGNVHTVWVRFMHRTERVTLYSGGEGLVDETALHYHSLTHSANSFIGRRCVVMELDVADAAGKWIALVNLCHLLDRMDLVDTRRVNKDGGEITRQQARAAARSGEQEIREIVLRPGVKRRDILHALSRGRIDMLRAHPRRHLVDEHPHRYHTKQGVITRSVATYQRGGRIGEKKQVYDARKVGENASPP